MFGNFSVLELKMKFIDWLKKAVEKTDAFLQKMPVAFIFAWCIVTNLIVETASRHSLWRGIIHIFTDFGVFFYNTVIILFAALICFLFKRRFFSLLVATIPFMILGIANGIVTTYRSTPISATDFIKISSVFGVFQLYVKWYVFLLALVAVILIAVVLVRVFKRCRQMKREWKKALVALPVTAVMIAVLTPLFIKTQILSDRFTNLPDAYRDYGFIYCFSCSVFDTGISRPSGYSSEKVDTILDEIRAEEDLDPEEKPNIIFLQLESFFDPNHISSVEFSRDPTPFFNSLKSKYPHGYLTVPYIGAGTANVEFEVLTGMNLDFFGPGEYPYKTVLQKSACESLAFNLRELGYTSCAIHNHKALFYDRAHVFASLGFDRFISLEFMQDVEYNPISWACDGVLTKEINSALDMTSGTDFIFTIGVQSHGAYPEEPIEGYETTIDAEIFDAETNLTEPAVEYYASQLYEVDSFLEALVASLEKRNEKTVLVVYGDHLPYIELREEDLINADLYSTEFVVWSNYEIEEMKDIPDLYTYQLGANVLSRLGMNNGLITKLHQNCSDSPDYMKYLEMLQYDMLYGSRECFGVSIGYEPTSIVLGINAPEITEIKNTEEGFEVKGKYFTPFSRVAVNGDKLDTLFIDNDTLQVLDTDLVYGDEVVVHQTNAKRTTFRRSAAVVADQSVDPPPYDVEIER